MRKGFLPKGTHCENVLEPKVTNSEFAKVELRVPDSLAPSVMRAFSGRTRLDAEVDALPVPDDPCWLNLFVRMLRWYRRTRPLSISRRCVLDPSCSRDSEMAFRRHGPVGGTTATLRRLWRCRPGAGGVDLP